MEKIACQTITWGDEKNSKAIDQIMKKVAEVGYEGVEIGARHLDIDRPGYYLALLTKNDLELVALHVGGKFLLEELEKDRVKNVKETIEFAQQLGAEFIFASGVFPDNFPDPQIKPEKEYKKEAEVYNAVGEICSEYGINFCYHNHNWEIINNLAGLNTILNNTDDSYVSLVPDVGWIAQAGADPKEVIKDNLARIKAVHFKDFTQESNFTEVGSGIVDFKEVNNVLEEKEQESDFWIVAEQDETEMTPQESVKINYSYTKQLIT